MRERHSDNIARIVKGADAPSYYNFEGGGGGGGGVVRMLQVIVVINDVEKLQQNADLKKIESSLERRLNELEVKREGLVIK